MLRIEFVLSENDYLVFFIHRASQSTLVQKRRNKGWILITVVFAMFAYIFYADHNQILAVMFAAMAMFWGILYPFQVKKSYIDIIKKQTLPLLKYNFDKPVTIIFNDSDITASTFAGESKIFHSALEKIIEINSHYFIYIKTGNSFIIPKFGLEKIEALETILEGISKKLDIVYVKDLDFKTPLPA